MASLKKGAIRKLLTGRTTIGITGRSIENTNELTTIDIDVVTSFVSESKSTVAKFPIEKDESKPEFVNITDHVIQDEPTLTIEAVISDNLDLKLTTYTEAIYIERDETSNAKYKLKMLQYWQRTGSVIMLNGYGTGSSLSSFVYNLMNDPESRHSKLLFNWAPKLNEPYYLGIDTDLIPDLVITKNEVKRTTESKLGENIGITLSMQRINIAEARTDKRVIRKSCGKTKPVPKSNASGKFDGGRSGGGGPGGSF